MNLFKCFNLLIKNFFFFSNKLKKAFKKKNTMHNLINNKSGFKKKTSLCWQRETKNFAFFVVSAPDKLIFFTYICSKSVSNNTSQSYKFDNKN